MRASQLVVFVCGLILSLLCNCIAADFDISGLAEDGGVADSDDSSVQTDSVVPVDSTDTNFADSPDTAMLDSSPDILMDTVTEEVMDTSTLDSGKETSPTDSTADTTAETALDSAPPDSGKLDSGSPDTGADSTPDTFVDSPPPDCNLTYNPLENGSPSKLILNGGTDLSAYITVASGMAPFYKAHTISFTSTFASDGSVKFPLVFIMTAKGGILAKAQDSLGGPRNVEYFAVNTLYFDAVTGGGDRHGSDYFQQVNAYFHCEKKIVPIPTGCPAIPTGTFTSKGVMSDLNLTFSGEERVYVGLSQYCK